MLPDANRMNPSREARLKPARSLRSSRFQLHQLKLVAKNKSAEADPSKSLSNRQFDRRLHSKFGTGLACLCSNAASAESSQVPPPKHEPRGTKPEHFLWKIGSRTLAAFCTQPRRLSTGGFFAQMVIIRQTPRRAGPLRRARHGKGEHGKGGREGGLTKDGHRKGGLAMIDQSNLTMMSPGGTASNSLGRMPQESGGFCEQAAPEGRHRFGIAARNSCRPSGAQSRYLTRSLGLTPV